MSTPTTTIRVSVATRDRLLRAREHGFADVSLDQIIARLLDEHADAELRAQMRQDAERARANADDLAEVRQVQAELDELIAW